MICDCPWPRRCVEEGVCFQESTETEEREQIARRRLNARRRHIVEQETSEHFRSTRGDYRRTPRKR